MGNRFLFRRGDVPIWARCDPGYASETDQPAADHLRVEQGSWWSESIQGKELMEAFAPRLAGYDNTNQAVNGQNKTDLRKRKGQDSRDLGLFMPETVATRPEVEPGTY